MIRERPDGTHMDANENARRNGFLPPEYNLRFSAADLQYVVVGQESDKAIVRDFAAKNTCLVSAGEIAAKLVTFGELAGRGR